MSVWFFQFVGCWGCRGADTNIANKNTDIIFILVVMNVVNEKYKDLIRTSISVLIVVKKPLQSKKNSSKQKA
jgi:hypothetical protein